APGATGLLGQLQATAPTVREMMETTVRFSELSLRPVVPEWEDYGENGIFSARLPVNNIMSIRQLTDLLMAVLVDRIRLAAGANWAPRDICFETTKPPMSRIYYDIFGDGLRFGEPTFSITIERGVMDRQMPNNILGLHNTILPLAEEALADLRKREGFKGTVAGEIRRQLSSDRDARISLASVAEGIGLSGRALQWRLTQDGSDYHTVLGEVREEIALKLLEETKMQIADIAIAIGFAETSVFTRWAIRTLGDRPSAIRRKMEKGTWSGPTPQPDGKPASATADTSSDTT
ncbi:MAG: AraC family transcriptional regulator ligand-binding domain-containing protein, partial [Pseudomonadota bacterium]